MSQLSEGLSDHWHSMLTCWPFSSKGKVILNITHWAHRRWWYEIRGQIFIMYKRTLMLIRPFRLFIWNDVRCYWCSNWDSDKVQSGDGDNFIVSITFHHQNIDIHTPQWKWNDINQIMKKIIKIIEQVGKSDHWKK